jgi:Proteasome subunit
VTLIVGIRCQDGIVLGSDAAATSGTLLDGNTIVLATSKLEVYGGYVVLGVAGAVGMGQNFHRTLSQHVTDHSLKRRPWKSVSNAREWLRDSFWPFVKPGWDHATELNKNLNPAFHQGVFSAVNTSSLVAFPIEDECHLLELDHLCEPMECTDNLPFATIGIGKVHADPFLAFIRRIFWPSSPPTLQDGIFATVWALQQAIMLSPGGVGGPITVVTLANNDGRGWKARKLTNDELGEHQEAISAVEADMAEVLAKFFTSGTTRIPGK